MFIPKITATAAIVIIIANFN